jgi:hypothetical protein
MSRRLRDRAPLACAAAAIRLVAAFSMAAPLATAAAAITSPAVISPAVISPAVISPAVASPATTSPEITSPVVSAPTTTSPAITGSADNASADTAPTDDIHDIRGPKGTFPLWQAAALLAAVALLAAGGYAAWRWTRRRRAPRALQLFEIALQRLEDIRRLMQPSSVREFSIAISDIVRRYIEDQFKVTATHRTTEEFLHDLLGSSNAVLAAHRNLLEQFLQQCDMAKFAGVGLSMQIMETLHQSARLFVIESSKPLPPAQTPEAASASARGRPLHSHSGGA